MAAADTSMTTQEFAEASGIPAAAVSRLIRQGKLKAHKKAGKWRIPRSELRAPGLPAGSAAGPAPAPKAAALPAAAGEAAAAAGPAAEGPSKTLSIAQFAAMTYLTEKGVAEWLKTGKLEGRQVNGEWRLPESNLEAPAVRRLIRR
jgi:excisionase family DNA binding protein